MKESEFWNLMDWAFPNGRAQSFAVDTVLASLGGKTVRQALENGLKPRYVWECICDYMDFPERYTYAHRHEQGK